jgi:hypothetical protein
VIDGADDGGVTETVEWKGGGGFRYFRLAPSLLDQDKWGNWVISKEYNAEMLAEALCKLEGFTYSPSDTVYWNQGFSTERDFIYTTTANLSHEQLQQLDFAIRLVIETVATRNKDRAVSIYGSIRATATDAFWTKSPPRNANWGWSVGVQVSHRAFSRLSAPERVPPSCALTAIHSVPFMTISLVVASENPLISTSPTGAVPEEGFGSGPARHAGDLESRLNQVQRLLPLLSLRNGVVPGGRLRAERGPFVFERNRPCAAARRTDFRGDSPVAEDRRLRPARILRMAGRRGDAFYRLKPLNIE